MDAHQNWNSNLRDDIRLWTDEWTTRGGLHMQQQLEWRLTWRNDWVRGNPCFDWPKRQCNTEGQLCRDKLSSKVRTWEKYSNPYNCKRQCATSTFYAVRATRRGSTIICTTTFYWICCKCLTMIFSAFSAAKANEVDFQCWLTTDGVI